MSEDRDIISASSEVVKPKRSARTNETLETNTITSPYPSNNDGKILSRYLRPPVGSCHDLCKYGIKHDYKDKKRQFFLRFLANNQMPDGEYSQSNFITAHHRRQESELKPRTTRATDALSDKTKLNDQMDLPPEKIIRISTPLTNLAAGSVHESSSLKLNDAPHDQTNSASLKCSAADQDEKSSEEFMDITSNEHESNNLYRGLFWESITMKLDRTATQNGVATEEHVPITQVGGSPEEPDSIKFMISSTTHESVASPEYKAANPSEGSSVKHCIELITESPITDNNMVSGECQTANGMEESSKKPIIVKVKTLPGSSQGLSSLKLMNHKSKESAKGRPANRAELASKEALSMKLKTSSPIQKSPSSTMNRPTDKAGFSEEQIQVKSSRIGDKIKRELNKLKSEHEKTGVSDRRKVTKQEQDISSGSKFVKKNSALRKSAQSVRLETNQEQPSFVKSTVASVTPRVKKTTLSHSKTIDASAKPSTILKLKDWVKSSSPSISSTGLSGQRKQEKIIKAVDKLNGGKEKIFEPLSNPSSTKPQLARVSSMNLRKYRKVVPSFTVKSQAKSRKFGLKEKTVKASEPNLEHVLKTLKQKLRKHKSYQDRKGEHEAAGSQLSGVSEPVLHREVPQRTYRNVLKSEMKSGPGRITSVNSEDKIGTPQILNFSRVKVVNLLSENNSSPIRLRFRQVKEASDNQKSKEIGTKNLRTMVSDGGGSNTSLLESQSHEVVLKHQDVDGKKDTQGLFNNVIEETASKLVESRKSKVKALVGAFETVISLQESKGAPLIAVP